MRTAPTRAWATACLLVLAACERAPRPAEADAGAMQGTVAQARASDDARPAPATGTVRDPATHLAAAIHADDTLDTLRERFGAHNVRIAQVPAAENLVRGIVLFPDDPARRAYLYFADPDRLRTLELVRVFDDASTWRLDNGVRVGLTLGELVAMNGRPLDFTGFGWDYGGAIADWHEGKLAPPPGVVRQGFALQPDDDLPEGANLPQGEGTFRSDDPQYPGLLRDVRVGELFVGFPRAADGQSSNR
jgi:hypothetical protein